MKKTLVKTRRFKRVETTRHWLNLNKLFAVRYHVLTVSLLGVHTLL